MPSQLPSVTTNLMLCSASRERARLSEQQVATALRFSAVTLIELGMARGCCRLSLSALM